MDRGEGAIAPPIRQSHIVRTEAFITGLVTSVLLLMVGPTLRVAALLLLFGEIEWSEVGVPALILGVMLAATSPTSG